MSKHKVGFTLVEISLFLAITGLLFLSVTIGVQNSIYQQRFSEAVQSFADFLGNIYSETLNVQSSGTGRTKKAIYGKLVVFPNGGSEQTIKVYSVVGDAANSGDLSTGGTLELLGRLNADIVDEEGQLAGIVDQYKPKWGSRIQKVDGFVDYTGSVLVVRDPRSGTVQTYVSGDVYDVDDSYAGGSGARVLKLSSGGVSNFKYNFGQVDFCVNPDGNAPNDRRADVRLWQEAHNRAGVEMMSLDDAAANVCNSVSGGAP